MARRFHPRSSPIENLRDVARIVPWKLLLLLPVILVVAIPTFLYGSRIGGQVLPAITNLFYGLSDTTVSITPTPLPAFPRQMPVSGSIHYTVQDGDSCDSILTYQMHMVDAGEVFSDVKPETVKALNASVGHDCHRLQPGMVLSLTPHYPLVAIGGVVQKILDASTKQQVLPTPLINVQRQEQISADCSSGCRLQLRIAPNVQVSLLVQTTLSVREGSWVWAQAALGRQKIKGFDSYPYAVPAGSLDGMTMHACDLQVDNTHDDNSTSCDQLNPNTIDDDGGSWLLGVTGPGALDHWGYRLKQPAGTRVMVWLSAVGGDLKYRPGNPLYRYDDASQLYVKV